MRKCAFLTMDSLAGHVCDDDMLYRPLKGLGWEVSSISWQARGIEWGDFETIIIRSTWDYQDQVEDYLRVLHEIDRSGARLENDIRLIRWNIDKSYLNDLEQKGIRIVPTLWEKTLVKNKIFQLFEELATSELVFKPAISACANDTFKLSPDDLETMSRITAISRDRDFMIQPFMNGITREGEFSLVYFGGKYSHTVLKQPKPDDFRVQEEYGGFNRLVAPEPTLLSRAEEILDALDIKPLYARVDMVRQGHDFFLMELELIEPSLYLSLDPESPGRFAQALDGWYQ